MVLSKIKENNNAGRSRKEIPESKYEERVLEQHHFSPFGLISLLFFHGYPPHANFPTFWLSCQGG